MSRTDASAPSSSAAAGWTTLTFVYLALGIVGLIGTWTWNIQAIVDARDFIGDWTMSGPAVSSLTTDLLVVFIAGSIFILVEARRLGMRAGWAYVVGGLVTAFAFTFPLFLAMRHRRLVRGR
ncbi:MAG: DUF2834 domain-containing protein [Cryobacterium sp.]